jgi:hypothetical protein
MPEGPLHRSVTAVAPDIIDRMNRVARAGILSVILASCAAPDAATPPDSDMTTSDAASPEATAVASETADAGTPSVSAVASPSAQDASEPVIDGLAEVIVDDLSVRDGPTTTAARVGLLPVGERAYVVDGPVEADGYRWYQLASVAQPYVGTCGDPAPEPSLACAVWFGWAASASADGQPWLAARAAQCPTARDTAAYLSLVPAERLACAGSDEWRLRAYVAPQTEGRGCLPVYVVDPFWMDASCNLLFLQPEETQFASFEGLQVFVPPDVGSCTADSTAQPSDCPFESLKGSWVEVTGHLDDASAGACVPVLSGSFEEAPYPPPSTDEVVFRCRTQLVVTGVTPDA